MEIIYYYFCFLEMFYKSVFKKMEKNLSLLQNAAVTVFEEAVHWEISKNLGMEL